MKEEKIMEKNFMTVDDVAEELSVSKSKAYKIVRQLNKELEEKYCTGQVSGKENYWHLLRQILILKITQ